MLLRSYYLGVVSEGKSQKLEEKICSEGRRKPTVISAVTQENLNRKALGGDVMDS